MKSLEEGPKLGVEWFGQYGTTSDWLSGDEQEHQVGPVAIWGFDNDWSRYTGALFGVTDASDHTQLRFRVGKAF